MVLIQPIGQCLSVDTEGYLINPCGLEHITSPWLEAVEAVKAGYLQHLGESAIHSLYVRGSVAKGTAIIDLSDVDTFAVVQGQNVDLAAPWRDAFQQQMLTDYPFQTGVEMWCIPYTTLCSEPEARSIQILIKTQSVCIWGEDLAPQFPKVKPGKDMVGHLPTLHKDIQEVLAELPTAQEPEEVKEICQWIMKRLVRSGFELVMEKEKTFTRDLYPCYCAFSRSFPEQAPSMKQALEWAIAPTANCPKISSFLQSFGSWLVTTITMSESKI